MDKGGLTVKVRMQVQNEMQMQNEERNLRRFKALRTSESKQLNEPLIWLDLKAKPPIKPKNPPTTRLKAKPPSNCIKDSL